MPYGRLRVGLQKDGSKEHKFINQIKNTEVGINRLLIFASLDHDNERTRENCAVFRKNEMEGNYSVT